MVVPIVRQRVKRPKVRSGCRTCKARHVKCDETRPACQRCITSQRVCEEYNDDRNDTRDRSTLMRIAPRQPKPTDGPIRAMTNIHIRLSPGECQAFDFFRLETIKQLPGGSSDLLWERLALCMSANEPAVAHAVVALASLHRSFAHDVSDVLDSTQYQLALQHCNKAMSSMRGIIAVPSSTTHTDSDVEILLILTLLLFSFEVLHGHWDRAALHLRSGLRVVYDNIRCQPDQLQHQGLREDPARHAVLLRVTPCSNIDIMLRAFVRLDGDSISGGEDGYLYPMCDKRLPDNFFSLEEANIHLDTLSSSITEIKDDLDLIARGNVTSSEELISIDARMSNYFCAFDRPMVDLDQHPSLALRLEDARSDIRKWLAAFTNIPVTDENAMEHRLTRIFGFYTWLSVETCQNEDHTTLKQFEEQACYIVGVMEEYVDAYHDSSLQASSSKHMCQPQVLPGITMGTGLVSCICLIIAKFQHPHIRQRCMMLLRTIRPCGPFYSDDIVHYMQAVVDAPHVR